MARTRKLSDSDTNADGAKKPKTLTSPFRHHLETIDVKKLDFDQEKICSVTLSPLNVYCCLVCGKFLQGRGENSVAFLHSIQEDHHVFMNLNTKSTYVLPENNEVPEDPALQRIRYAICPSYTKEDLATYPRRCFDMANNLYLNGFVGFIEPKNTSHLTVVLQLLAHISPLRDHLALISTEDSSTELLKRLSTIVKKLWSPYLFRTHVSPHEFLHQLAVSNRAPLKADPKNFLLWLVNHMNACDAGLKKVLTKTLRGEINMATTAIREESTEDAEKNMKFVKDESSTSTKKLKFWTLSLDLPPMPLFTDGFDTNSIPQVGIESLLEKFMGAREIHTKEGIKKYTLSKLPKYLLLHVDRFNGDAELPIKTRNQTLVKFPETLKINGRNFRVIMNLTHDAIKGKYTEDKEIDYESQWKAQILEPKDQQWYELDGKTVTLKEKELLFLSESYLQVWEALD
ncbi:LAME_0A03906g1_1 [Lachancea meyersii CBS 8951]|uniref:LAME_0A03906g1_1 n=1 Tax=Lachancea meyersii CBS 8951 TaxID=1266667 RepID=A0A1G4IP65_9SACH|nr:LAME_0A03906g1_1 [Lachancea meyersii CBS 8951]